MKIDNILKKLQAEYYGKVRTLDISKNSLNDSYTLTWRPWVFYSLSLITGNRTYSSIGIYVVTFTKEVFDDDPDSLIEEIKSFYINPTIEVPHRYFAGCNTSFVIVPKKQV